MYQPKTGAKCTCKRGVMRDNCSTYEGTGWVIDFALIRAARRSNAVIQYAWPSTGKTCKIELVDDLVVTWDGKLIVSP